MNVTLIAALVAAVVGATGAWQFQENRWQARTLAAQAAIKDVAIEAQRLANATQTRQSTQVIKAQNEQTQRTQIARADADRARTELDSLRDTLAASGYNVPGTTTDACRQHASATAELLQQCAARYQSLAGKADGHVIDTVTLQQAWATP